MPLQEVVVDFLKVPLDNSPAQKHLKTEVNIQFKIVKARGLLQRDDGSARDSYCDIQFGNIPNPNKPPKVGTQVFMTEVCNSTLSPSWYQDVSIKASKLTDVIVVSVWDWKLNEFLGRVVVPLSQAIEECTAVGSQGTSIKWYSLGMTSSDSLGKFVGGEIMLDITVDPDQITKSLALDPIADITPHLKSCKLNLSALYKILLKGCLRIDAANPTTSSNIESTISMHRMGFLSLRSRAILEVWQDIWLVKDSTRAKMYLELVFAKCKALKAPVWALWNAYEDIHRNLRVDMNWVTPSETQALATLLDEIYSHYRLQPVKALDHSLLLLRTISKNPILQGSHSNIPYSFRSELKGVLIESAKFRFKRHQKKLLTSGELDMEAVIGGLITFVSRLKEDLQDDYDNFQIPFEVEANIVKISSKTYIDLLCWCVECILYFRIRKHTSYEAFTITQWFHPFIARWLERFVKTKSHTSMADFLQSICDEIDIIASVNLNRDVWFADFVVIESISNYCGEVNAIAESRYEETDVTICEIEVVVDKYHHLYERLSPAYHYKKPIGSNTTGGGGGAIRESLEAKYQDLGQRIMNSQDSLLNALCIWQSYFMEYELMHTIRENEAVPDPSSLIRRKSLFRRTSNNSNNNNPTNNNNSSRKLSPFNAAGIQVAIPITREEGDSMFLNVVDCLGYTLHQLHGNPHLPTLIGLLWDEALSIIEHVMVAPLRSVIEMDRRPLNPRQLSICEFALVALRGLFEYYVDAKGVGVGVLDDMKYGCLEQVIGLYYSPLPHVQAEYEGLLKMGGMNEYLLRLVRMNAEKSADGTDSEERKKARKWFKSQVARLASVPRLGE
ncbi:hypothetical protein BDR26DRAFT_850846 [Obelidium mucronatum]|nr:hypothetical protein BDR26DRAFT_850846 [Obelidium mucronatum]